MPDTKPLALTALAAAIAALMIAMSGSLTLASAAQNNCQNIEALNERVRANAKNSYNETVIEQDLRLETLEEDAALLGIVVTPQLRERVAEEVAAEKAKALAAREDALREFPPRDCPFLLLPTW